MDQECTVKLSTLSPTALRPGGACRCLGVDAKGPLTLLEATNMAVRITCINKSGGYHADPHHAIANLGWKNDQTSETGKSSRLEFYNWINRGGVAYVVDSRGNKASVGTRENANGTKYLQTYADRVWTDNLLALPECN